jgi:hypothetical protein
VSVPKLSFITRLWFSLVCLLRILLDGAFAGRVWAVRSGMPALPPPRSRDSDDGEVEDDEDDEDEVDEQDEQDEAAAAEERAHAIAAAPLQLLALLQREGRLIDFLQQDITDFDDDDVGAAARVVHEGCRKALAAHADVEPIREEAEDSPVRIDKGFDPAAIKLTGEVEGKPPYAGMLRHRGWRVKNLELPEAVEGYDFTVVAPAEVEL